MTGLSAKHRWFERVARWALGGVFLYAAVPKILDPHGFAFDIRNYQFLPDPLVNPLAAMLPWVEAFSGLALISGFLADGAIMLVTSQLCVFIVALAQAYFRGLDIDCGCFGHGSGGRSVAKALIEDFAFISMAIYCLWVRFFKAARPQ